MNCSRSSGGTARRSPSTSAINADRSGTRGSFGGAPTPASAQPCHASQPGGGRLGSSGPKLPPRPKPSPGGGPSPLDWLMLFLAFEGHLQRAVLEARAARAVGGQPLGQHYRALLPADADDHLEPDLLQIDVALLRERQGQPQRGVPVLRRQLL